MLSRLVPFAFFLVACGASQPQDTAAPEESGPKSDGGSKKSTLDIQADIGAMNESEVLSTFQKAQGSLMGCFEKGSRRVRFLGGKVRFHIRVDQGGAVKSAHLEDSTLGDRETESCMLGVVRERTWPSPQGGREGIAETEFAFDPASDVRAPVDWAPEDAGKNVRSARSALAKCARTAGAGALKATLYVETDGSVMAVGVSGENAATEEAASCVVSALKEVKFNSPGSYAAKMTLGE